MASTVSGYISESVSSLDANILVQLKPISQKTPCNLVTVIISHRFRTYPEYYIITAAPGIHIYTLLFKLCYAFVMGHFIVLRISTPLSTFCILPLTEPISVRASDIVTISFNCRQILGLILAHFWINRSLTSITSLWAPVLALIV